MTPRSCCCQMLVSRALWGILCLFVPTGSVNLMLSCRSTSSPISCWRCLQRVAAAPFSRWSTRTWGFDRVGSMLLPPSALWLLVVGAPLLLVVLLLLPAWTSLGKMDLVDPCMLWICISILHMWHCCHHMLGVWVWVCVLLPSLLFHHLPVLPLLCVLVLVVSCWESLGVLGSSPLPVVHCCCLEMPLDRHSSATMKIQGSCWSVCCTAEPVHCCSKSFVARVVLLSCQMLS